MSNYVKQLFKLVLLTCTGLAGCLIVGLMRYGGDVFSFHSVAFSFVAYGMSGAFIFAFYHVRGLSETITAAVVVSALQFAASTTWITVLNAAVWSFGVNLPIILVAFIFERKLAPFKQFKFVVVAGLYGAMFVLLTLLVAWLSGAGAMPASVFRENFVDGLLIGVGLALGIEAGEAFLHSLEHHSTTEPGSTEKHA